MCDGRLIGLSVMAALWSVVVILLFAGLLPITAPIVNTIWLFGSAVGGAYAYIRVRGERVIHRRRK